MGFSNAVLTPLNLPISAALPTAYLCNYGGVAATCISSGLLSTTRWKYCARSLFPLSSDSCFTKLSGLKKCTSSFFLRNQGDGAYYNIQRHLHSWGVLYLSKVCLKLSVFSADLEQASHSKLLSRCRVQSEDQEGTSSGENILTDQQALELELQIAVEEENYALAAKIRDSLKNLHEDSRALVLAANARFYNSFRTGDLAGMQALWAKGDHVCCVHPGVPVISGYDLVIQSWEYVLADYEFPLKIELKDVLVHVRGDLGYVTCVEFIKTTGSSWGRQTATNVFERINGQWFICIHHATRIVT